MNLTTHTMPRLRRSLRAGALVLTSLGAFAGLSALDAPTAAAESGLAINELAPEISTAADRALIALDNYLESGSVADQRTLAFHRAAAARWTALELGYDDLAMVNAWATTPIEHQRALLGALSQVGVPYRTNTSIEDEGFDCSGLTSFAWAGAGYDLYRQSGSQISQARSLTREEAKAGDLVHYPGHIMMYLGVDDAVVHSVNTGRTVEVDVIRRDSVRFGDPTQSA